MKNWPGARGPETQEVINKLFPYATEKYKIVRQARYRPIVWDVYLGDRFIERFKLKRDATDWIMAQEYPKK